MSALIEDKTIFFLGATGYIGSAVFSKLLQYKKQYPITALSRSDEKVELLNKLRDNVKGLKGSLSDLDLLEEQASKHDIIFNTADADDLKATKALLKGMAKRKAETGHRPVYIHTSGTGVLADDAAGNWDTMKIYSDLGANSEAKPPLLSIDSLPDTALHRNVDLLILEADARADIRSFIILPSTIYGLNNAELVEKGIGNNQSIQMPALIKASIDRKRPGVVGKGHNIWPNVHIKDVAELFMVVYDLALAGNKGNHGRQGYFFAESGEHTLFAVGQTIGQAMVKYKLTDNPEPSTFSKEEIDKYFGGSDYLGSNSRARGDRSRRIGWRPKYEAEDFFRSLDEEVKITKGKANSQGSFDFGGKL
ncbi:hypothetical protein NliqN6_3084 [Naganishia liquefaciens]|uniref:NAD(P)-binding domain-containing protein n=1 Tax=Naganishia liquefaciens TaxID=104408 RepID=A0A8H3YFY4_9TREE|nr:hypothetical protein NliqN6_3084 [Naganishia liquefaciens]